jgi:hypothetical protein
MPIRAPSMMKMSPPPPTPPTEGGEQPVSPSIAAEQPVPPPMVGEVRWGVFIFGADYVP